jgi:hypothetical protein
LLSNWARSEERRQILKLLRRSGMPQRELRPERLREAILTAMADDSGHATGLLKALEALLAAHLVSILLQAGLSSRWASPAAPGRLDLHACCKAATRWIVVGALLVVLGHRRHHPRAWRTPRGHALRLTRQYEAHAREVEAAVHGQLRRLGLLLWTDLP